MKIALKILIAVVSVIGLLLVVALFVKRDYVIYREIVINRSSKEVFDFVRFQKNQEQYSKWVMADPQMKKEYMGVDGQLGFIYAWDSDVGGVGKGEQEIINLVEGERLELVIRFKEPFENIATTIMTTEALAGEQTKVSWSMKGQSIYPMNLMNPIIDDLLGKDLEVSLANLKTILEK